MLQKNNRYTRNSYLWVTVSVLGGALFGALALSFALFMGWTNTTAPVVTLFSTLGFYMAYLFRMLYLVPQFDVCLSMGETRQALYRSYTLDSILFTLYGFALCALVIWLDPMIYHAIAPNLNTTELIIREYAVDCLTYGFPIVVGFRMFYMASVLRFRKAANCAFAIAYFVCIIGFPNWVQISADSLLGQAIALCTTALAQVSPVLLTLALGLVLWGLGAIWVKKVAVKM